MNDEKNSFEIRCGEYFVVRLIQFAILLIAAIVIVTNTKPNDALIFVFYGITWTFFLIVSLISSPDLIFHEDGLTIVTFRKRIFVGWEEFKGVQKNSITTNIYIYSPRYSFLTKLLIPYPIQMIRWWKNYAEVNKLLGLKLGDRYFVTW